MPELTNMQIPSSTPSPGVCDGDASSAETARQRSGRAPRSRSARIFARLAATVLILTGGTALFHTKVSADEGFPGLERLMTVEQFRRTGLSTLSDSELEALNEWLIEYTAGDARILQETSEAVREAEKNFEIKSRITGEFSGWEGDTIFRLDNGQIWQQRLAGRNFYRGPANPMVRISKNFLGFYKMTLVESGKSIGVKRLR